MFDYAESKVARAKYKELLLKSFDTQPLTQSAVEWKKAIEFLINSKGGRKDLAIEPLANFIAKERDSAVTEQDYLDAQALVTKVTSGKGSSLDSLIADIFKPAGGSERFTNLRTPGVHSAKNEAQGHGGDYGRRAETTGDPETREAAGTSGFYDSSQIGFSDAETRGNKTRETTGAGVRDTQRLGYGSTSQGTSESDARSQSYGRAAYHYGQQRSEPGRTTTITTKALRTFGPEESRMVEEAKDSSQLSGISAEVYPTGEIENNPLKPMIGKIIDSKLDIATDKNVQRILKKRNDEDLTKAR